MSGMNLGKIFLIFSISAIVAFLLLNFNVITLAVAALFIFLPLLIMHPYLYFLMFILLRPIFDIWAGAKLAGVNIASIFTFSLIIICGADILIKKENWYKIRANLFLRRLNKFFILFLFFSLPSFINTKDFFISLTDFLRLVSVLIAVNYVSVYFSTEEKAQKVVKLILFSSVIPLFFGLYQFISKAGVAERGFNRIYATFAHPNVFAEYLLIIFFLVLFVLDTYSRKKLIKFIIIGFLSLVFFELFNTFTRVVWIAGVACFLMYTLVRTKFSKKLVCLAVIIIISLLVFPYVQERFQDISHQSRPYQMSSWEWRLNLWRQTIGSLKEHIFIGNGLGMYQSEIGMMAHNDYIRLCYESGILGLISYLGILTFIFFSAFKRMRGFDMTGSRAEINRSKLTLMIILAMLIISFTNNLIRSTVVLFYYLVVCAVFNNGSLNKRTILESSQNESAIVC